MFTQLVVAQSLPQPRDLFQYAHDHIVGPGLLCCIFIFAIQVNSYRITAIETLQSITLADRGSCRVDDKKLLLDICGQIG